MYAFAPAPGGFTSRLDEEERSILARLASDVATLIADDGRSHPVEQDDSVDPIAHLDFHPAEVEDDTDDIDPALSRVFPPMSLSDPDLAREMRGLTMANIREGKLANLSTVVNTLSAAGTQVHVAREDVDAWLSALTDMRLVLASRLEIEDDEDAERVYRLAVEASRSDTPLDDGDEEMELAMAALYSGITWWQESLLEAVLRSGNAT